MQPPTVLDDDASRPAWAKAITEFRTQRGLSSAAAAQRMQISPQTWAGLEAGTRVRNGQRVTTVPKEDTLRRVASALDLTREELQRLLRIARGDQQQTLPWQSRLRAMRLAAHVTPEHAAATAGVTLTTYKRWERKRDVGANHAALHRLLIRLGLNPEQADHFLHDVPPAGPTARPPSQPTNPVRELPAWSQLITRKRLELGLYFVDVDRALNQQGVVRRYELGGWPRPDGRLSVPSITRLNRIAAALNMNPAESAELHLLADNHRLVTAAQGPKPLLAELIHETRRAHDLTLTQAAAATPDLPKPWGHYESGQPGALSTFTAEHLRYLTQRLPISPLLTAAMEAAILQPSESAENNTEPDSSRTRTRPRARRTSQQRPVRTARTTRPSQRLD